MVDSHNKPVILNETKVLIPPLHDGEPALYGTIMSQSKSFFLIKVGTTLAIWVDKNEVEFPDGHEKPDPNASFKYRRLNGI